MLQKTHKLVHFDKERGLGLQRLISVDEIGSQEPQACHFTLLSIRFQCK